MQEGYTAMDNLRAVDIKGSIEINHSFINYLYYCGVAISLLITLVSILKPLKLYLTADRLLRNHQMIIVHPSIQPFSFLGILFIRSGNEDPIVVAHEMVHIRQRHWIDLVLVEVTSIILWFNPIIYYYRRSIAIQHEYIADHQVTLNVPIKTYLECIAKELESKIHPTLVNSFNTQSIKQRIIMITNTKNYSASRYIIILPLVAVLIMAFATRKTTGILFSQNKELLSPVDVAKLKRVEGAGFGRRLNPITKSEVFHTGVDFVLAAGNSVYATADGVVANTSNSASYGNRVVIEHNKQLSTSSAHLESILVKEADKVRAGQVIGTVGSTGLSTGPHLHFEVIENGKAVDPAPYFKYKVE
jgi:hypothetical protein